MQLGLSSLFEFLDARPSGPLVLATIIKTRGTSYRKAGAMMLIDAHMKSSGLVSGGCLEDDLREHARAVLLSAKPAFVHYDLSQQEAASVWGLGLGCGGEIDILLERIDADTHYGGLAAVRPYWDRGDYCGLIKITRHIQPEQIGRFDVILPGQPIAKEFGVGRFEMAQQATVVETDVARSIAMPISPARRLIVCGAGADAIPLVQLATELSWRVTVIDHRPALNNPASFPGADRLLCRSPDEVTPDDLRRAQAAVIMTHNVDRDARYLQLLHAEPVQYIGLLGPRARRDSVVELAGVTVDARLHGPAGLDIGSVLPEEIALSILAEIHAVLSDRTASFLTGRHSRSVDAR